MAVDEPSKKCGHPLSSNNLPSSTPVWTDNKGKNRTMFSVFIFAIIVTVPYGTLNMHLKFEMPQKDKIKALSMQTLYVYIYIYISCIYIYIYIDMAIYYTY